MQRTLLLPLVTILLSLSTLGDTGMWGQRGFTRSFVSSGDFLYTADGRGVSVFNVAQPGAIARVDVEWSDVETYDAALMGTTDLIVATRAGLERFSVASNGTIDRLGAISSTTPVTQVSANAQYVAATSGKAVTLYERSAGGGLAAVRTYTFANPVTAIQFAGDSLFVAIERLPLHVFAPSEAGVVGLLAGADAIDMAVSGDVLWIVSDSDGLSAIDISDPAEPRVLSNLGRNELHLRGVTVAGTRVYAFESPDRLLVFDATDVEEPRLVTALTEWVNAIGASGTRLFVAGAIVDKEQIVFDPELTPRATGTPVRIFNAANLAAPVLAGQFEDYAGPVSGVWTDGSVAYVVDPPYLRVLDVSITSQPREVTRLAIPNIQDRIRVKNGLAVLYGRAFVNLVDVSVPLRPQYLGTWDAQGHPPSSAAILNTRIVEANDHSGMHVVDITDPAHGVQVGGRKWHYLDIAAGDDAVYALERDVMLVVEIVNETSIEDRDHIFIKYLQIDTVPPNVNRPELLLVRGGEGLRLYSLEDRFHPAEVDFLPLIGLGVFATTDQNAYIEKDGKVHFVSLAGRQITLEDRGDRVTSPMQMSAAGEKIVVADRYSVRIFGPDTAAPPPPPPPPPTAVRRRAVRP